MFIKNVYIKGFRSFEIINVPLMQFTTIIGKNDEGKSNFLESIGLVLQGDLLNNKSKRLGLSDINKKTLHFFNNFIKENKEGILSQEKIILDKLIEIIPVVNIRIRFENPENDYEKGLLKEFIMGDDIKQYYVIEYLFAPKDNNLLIEHIISVLQNDSDEFIPIELYEYNIFSSNNGKTVSFSKRKYFQGNFIFAERDMFSQDNSTSSMDLVSKILEKTVSNIERALINDLYKDFFNGLKELNSFKELFDYLTGTDSTNLKQFIETLELKPNTPKYKSIFSNVKISYGDEYLFQKGLGKRNFMYILLLFGYFVRSKSKYNFIGIEEPESHLSTDNLKLIMSFIYESMKVKNSLNQFIITTHRPEVINKLKLDNVIVLNEGKAISFEKADRDLVDYLSKRPNVDILKILFSKRLCLVEGVTEEMFINTMLEHDSTDIFDIDVISIGQRGFRSFMDLWLMINKETTNKLLVIRDYDNLDKSKIEHEKYEEENKNIKVATTSLYTFENDLIEEATNKKKLSSLLNCKDDKLEDLLKKDKAGNMLKICQELIECNIELIIPKYIKEKLEWLKK